MISNSGLFHNVFSLVSGGREPGTPEAMSLPDLLGRLSLPQAVRASAMQISFFKTLGFYM